MDEQVCKNLMVKSAPIPLIMTRENLMKTSIAILASVAALALAAPASAATIVFDSTGTALFSRLTTGSATSVTDTFTFTAPTSGTVLISMSSNNYHKLSFGTVHLLSDYDAHTTLGLAQYVNLGGLLGDPVVGGVAETLYITYTGTAQGTYNGNISFTPTVPEPATWGMMLVGLGMIGFAARRRQNTTVAYA